MLQVVCVTCYVYYDYVIFCICTASSPALQASMMFKPTRKMRVLNWKKLPHNTIRNSQLSLWQKHSNVAHSLSVNGDQIVELFSRTEITPKAKEEQTKTPSIVR